MRAFIIIAALLVVGFIGVRFLSGMFAPDVDQAPVTMTGENDEPSGANERAGSSDSSGRNNGASSEGEQPPAERAEQDLQAREQLLETQHDLERQQTIAPIAQEQERLQAAQELQEQRRALALERETTPYDLEQRRLEAERQLIQQRQALIREQQELEKLQAQQQQSAMPPMPETTVQPVTQF